jgi:hypothetical protein
MECTVMPVPTRQGRPPDDQVADIDGRVASLACVTSSIASILTSLGFRVRTRWLRE